MNNNIKSSLWVSTIAVFGAFFLLSSLSVWAQQPCAPQPLPPTGSSAKVICAGSSPADFQVNGITPGATVTWYQENRILQTNVSDAGGAATLNPMSIMLQTQTGVPMPYASSPGGQILSVTATQTVNGCESQRSVPVVIIQQPELPPVAAPLASASNVCNGTSLTLISTKPEDVLLSSSITLPTEIFWTKSLTTNEINTNPATSDRPTILFEERNALPLTGTQYTFSYVRRYRPGTISGYGVSVQQCPTNSSGNLQIMLFPSPNPGVLDVPRQVICSSTTTSPITLSGQETGSDITISWNRVSPRRSSTIANSTTTHSEIPPDGPGSYLYYTTVSRQYTAPNLTCSSNTDASTVIVQDLKITQQPKPVSVCGGGDAVFEIVVSSQIKPVTSNWESSQDNVTYQSAVGTSTELVDTLRFTVGPVDFATHDGMRYRVSVSDGQCSTSSDAAQLTVLRPPQLDALPAATSVCEGQDVSINIVANPVQPATTLTYQWQNTTTPPGQNIAGATSATLALTQQTRAANQGNTYRVVVTDDNDCRSQSTETTINVRNLPEITTQPVDVEVCEGANATFSVVVAGANPFSYRWRQVMPLPATDVGSNASRYIRTAVVIADNSSRYQVTVTDNNGCQRQSNEATLTVQVDSSPDVAANPNPAEICSGQELSISLSNPNQLSGTKYIWSVTNPPTTLSGATPVTTPSDGPIRQRVTSTSNVDQTLVYSVTPVYRNCQGASLDVIVTIKPAPTVATDRTEYNVCTGSAVDISITNPNSLAGTTFTWTRSTNANVTVAPPATAMPDRIQDSFVSSTFKQETITYTITGASPNGCSATAKALVLVESNVRITGDFDSNNLIELCPGDDYTFQVGAEGSSLAYQWRRNGNSINGATAATYPYKAVTADDNARYSVVVSNICDTNGQTSNDAVLKIEQGIAFKGTSLGFSKDIVNYGELVNFELQNYSGNDKENLMYDWDFGDGTQKSNLSSPGHNFIDTGEHTVSLLIKRSDVCFATLMKKITVNDNSKPDIWTSDPLSIGQEISYYPIPVKDQLTLTSVYELKSIRIQTLEGKTIWEEACSGNEKSIPAAQFWDRGVYILTVTHQQGVYTDKIIK